MSTLQAAILAIIEGLTEFLPISSTGHMIIASSMMGIADHSFTKIFIITIQFGTILSILTLYGKRFFVSLSFYYKLFIGFIPAAVVGLLLNDYIDLLLDNVEVVAIALIVGGVFFLFVDILFKKNTSSKHGNDISFLRAFKIGCFQTLAMIPGVSRSAATIIGGLSQKLNRKTAIEFSFFLAIPTMFAATSYKLFNFYWQGESLVSEQITLLAIGNVVAFIVAILAVKSFIYFFTRYGFAIFGYYRIILGVIILSLHFSGIKLSI